MIFDIIPPEIILKNNKYDLKFDEIENGKYNKMTKEEENYFEKEIAQYRNNFLRLSYPPNSKMMENNYFIIHYSNNHKIIRFAIKFENNIFSKINLFFTNDGFIFKMVYYISKKNISKLMENYEDNINYLFIDKFEDLIFEDVYLIQELRTTTFSKFLISHFDKDEKGFIPKYYYFQKVVTLTNQKNQYRIKRNHTPLLDGLIFDEKTKKYELFIMNLKITNF